LIEANQSSTVQGSANTSEFRKVFVARVHEVLEGGYRRLKCDDYATEEEPAITGDLRKAMHDFLRDLSAPDWADYISVHDDPPVDDGERKGKRRNRIDLRVDSSTPRPGASFSFEAKRLARGFTVGKYLGEDGLGSFLCGDYAQEDDDAGMIGYMQDDDVAYWSGEIVATIQKEPAIHGVSGSEWWTAHSFPRGPANVFISAHMRSKVGRPITIYHTLLLFTARTKTA